MARKVIKGVSNKYFVPGSSSRGYRPVWDAGPASYHKRLTKITGINRPSV